MIKHKWWSYVTSVKQYLWHVGFFTGNWRLGKYSPVLLRHTPLWRNHLLILSVSSPTKREFIYHNSLPCYSTDMTEGLHFDFSLSWIGGGNGNWLQCSGLENPMDRGAWGLPSMGSHRVGHDWSDLAAALFQIALRWVAWLQPAARVV